MQPPAREGHIVFLVRRPAGSLRVPQRFAESLHEHVFRAVPASEPNLQSPVQFAHSGRPIDGHLIAHRKMKAHM